LANLLCEFVKHPAQTTVTSLTSRKESFWALRRPRWLRTDDLQHNQNNCSWMS
jgi:hypothetical protein